MSFSITLTNPSENGGENIECLGEIVINDFQESFIGSLLYWSREDYKLHWREALKRALHKEDTCLITSLHDPQNANFIFWWLLYNREDEVIVRNHLLFLNSLPQPFNPRNPYLSIPKYERFNEDGETISEWSVSLDDIATFRAANW